MAFKFLDRARENTATVGAGNITFGGALSGFVTFSSGLANGDTTPYAVADGAGYEEGVLTYISASNTCSRAVSKSSNANAAISLSGTAVIFSTVRAADIGAGANNILQLDAAGKYPAADASQALGLPAPVSGGRLTLTSATPVLTTTLSGSATVYFTPYAGNIILVYDGTRFNSLAFSELSQTTTDATKSPAAAAASKNYDMFVWSDAGTLRCTRGPAWSSDTTRGTGAGTSELQRTTGIWTNKNAITNGPAAGLGTYVGSVRTNASSFVDITFGALGSGGIAGSVGVWNLYNRVPFGMLVQNSDNSWTYNTRAWRAPNGSATMRVSFLRGLDEDSISATYYALGQAVTNGDIVSGVGLDSTTAASGITGYCSAGINQVPFAAHYNGLPGLGWHFLTALEEQITTASGAATFFGDAGLPGEIQAGFSVSGRY